jgi:hypothetical protein
VHAIPSIPLVGFARQLPILKYAPRTKILSLCVNSILGKHRLLLSLTDLHIAPVQPLTSSGILWRYKCDYHQILESDSAQEMCTSSHAETQLHSTACMPIIRYLLSAALMYCCDGHVPLNLNKTTAKLHNILRRFITASASRHHMPFQDSPRHSNTIALLAAPIVLVSGKLQVQVAQGLAEMSKIHIANSEAKDRHLWKAGNKTRSVTSKC